MADEDEEVDYESNVVYEPELEGLLNDIRQFRNQSQFFDVGTEDDDDDEQDMGWDWDAPPPPAIIRGHHHHHHRHGLEMFGMMGGEPFRGTSLLALATDDLLTHTRHRSAYSPPYIEHTW